MLRILGSGFRIWTLRVQGSVEWADGRTARFLLSSSADRTTAREFQVDCCTWTLPSGRAVRYTARNVTAVLRSA